MYCQLSSIGGLELQHQACAALFEEQDQVGARAVILVRLNQESRIYGECNFKFEPHDEFKFKFCDELSTLVHGNLSRLVREHHVDRLLFLDESLKGHFDTAIHSQGLPLRTQMI